jgi:hypothetical protein
MGAGLTIGIETQSVAQISDAECIIADLMSPVRNGLGSR